MIKTKAIVGEAVMGQPARNSGIQDGDEIISVNGKRPVDWGEAAFLIRNAPTDPLTVEISRANQTIHSLSIKRVFTGDYMAIGISPVEEEVTYKNVSFLGSGSQRFELE